METLGTQHMFSKTTNIFIKFYTLCVNFILSIICHYSQIIITSDGLVGNHHRTFVGANLVDDLIAIS